MTPEIMNQVGEIERICRLRHWTLSLAESCTGGLASASICAKPGVSKFYLGSVVSYARSVKSEILGVSTNLLKTHGEVSLPVALAMAAGVRTKLKTTWSVSITGIAGPDGGSKEKPVGYICFAVAGPSFESAVHKQFKAAPGTGDGRQDIQRQATLFAFDFLLNAMR